MKNDLTIIKKKYRYRNFNNLKDNNIREFYKQNYIFEFLNNGQELFDAERLMENIDVLVKELCYQGSKISDNLNDDN